MPDDPNDILSGGLVPLAEPRVVTASAQGPVRVRQRTANALGQSSYDDIINRHAANNSIDPNLVRAVIAQESSGSHTAVSPKGARGLMQLMPATAQRFGVRNVNDPEQNIAAGTKYLKFLSDRYNGDTDKILAGYNAGEGNVDKYGGIPPFKETQNYVPSVKARYAKLSGQQQDPILSGGLVARPQPSQSTETPDILSGGLVETPQTPAITGSGRGAGMARAQGTTYPMRKSYDTRLTPQEETQFQSWKQQYAPNDTGADYDLRGVFKAGLTPDPKTGHWPDTFKKPNHPTFSNESQYAVGADAAKAGHWQQGDKFIPPSRRRAQPQQGWGGGGTIGQGVPNVSVNAMGGSQPSNGVGGLRQIDDPETARILRAQQQVTAEQTPAERQMQRAPGTADARLLDPHLSENEEVLRRVGAEKDQETQIAKQTAWEQENKAEIDRHVADYRKQIRDSGFTKWLTETQARGAGHLLEFPAGAADIVGATKTANAIRVRAVAAAQAAQEEGKGRTEASQFIQETLGSFAGSAPELLLMQAGVPPIATFAAGGGLRAKGMGRPVAPAITQGALTGAAFEIPEAGAPGVRGTLTRAGKVGAATAGVDLATGAPVGQALKSGAVNAAMVAGPGIANEPAARAAERARQIESQTRSGTSVPDIDTQLAAAVKPVMDAQGNVLLNADEIAQNPNVKPRIRLAGRGNEAQINRTTDQEVASIGSRAPGDAEGAQRPNANQPNVPRAGSEQGGVGPAIRVAPEAIASATDISEPVRRVIVRGKNEDSVTQSRRASVIQPTIENASPDMAVADVRVKFQPSANDLGNTPNVSQPEPIRHVDLQPRTPEGQFDEETPAQAEARRQQVTQSVSTPQPEPATQASPPTPDAASSPPVSQSTGAASVASTPAGADTVTEISKGAASSDLSTKEHPLKIIEVDHRGNQFVYRVDTIDKSGAPIALQVIIEKEPDGTIRIPRIVPTSDSDPLVQYTQAKIGTALMLRLLKELKARHGGGDISFHRIGSTGGKYGRDVLIKSAAEVAPMPESTKGEVTNEPKLQSVSKEELPLSSNQSQEAVLGASNTPSAEELRATDLPSGSRVAAPPVPEGKPLMALGGAKDTQAEPPLEQKPAQVKPSERSFPKTLAATGRDTGTDLTYEVVGDKDAVDKATARIAADPEAARQFALSSGNSTTPQGKERIATGLKLADQLANEAEKSKDPVDAATKHAQAIELYTKTATDLTEAGQTVQAASLARKYSLTGAPLEVVRIAKRNGHTPKAADIATVRDMAKRQDDLEIRLADVQKQIETMQAKGKEATKTAQPRAKAETLTGRLARMESEARARLEARAELAMSQTVGPKGQRGAGVNPVDVAASIADWTTIGAAKIARGGVNFANWSKEMISEFGDAIKPHLDKIFMAAHKMAAEQRGALKEESAQRSATKAGMTLEDFKQQRYELQVQKRQARLDMDRKFRELDKRAQRGPIKKTTEAIGSVLTNSLLSYHGLLNILGTMTVKEAINTALRVPEAGFDLAYRGMKRATGKQVPRASAGLSPRQLGRAAKSLVTEAPGNVAKAFMGKPSEVMPRVDEGATDSAKLNLVLDFMSRHYAAKEALVRTPVYNLERSNQASIMAHNDITDGVIKRSQLNSRIDDYLNGRASIDGPLNKKYAASLADQAADYEIKSKNPTPSGTTTPSAKAARVKEMMTNPTQLIDSQAMQYADKEVYANPLGPKMQKIQEALNAGGPIPRTLIQPFFKRPVNAFNDLLYSYTGARAIKEGGQAAIRGLQGKEWTPAERQSFNRAMARGGTVYELAALGAALAGRGLLTSGNDKQHPGSLKVGNSYYAIGNKPVIGWAIVAGATAKLDGTDAVPAAVGKMVIDHPLLKGLKNVTDATEEGYQAAQGNTAKMGKAATGFASKTIGRVIPTPLAATAETMDIQTRNTKGLLGPLKSRIPLVRQRLPPAGPKERGSAFDPFLAAQPIRLKPRGVAMKF